MEIISYPLEGALEHKDSTGEHSVIRPGDVQRMSAGTGVRHSEYNASQKDAVHFLQIWIIPERQGLPPGYEQKTFTEAEKRGKLRLVGSRDGREGSLTIHQDVDLYATALERGDRVSLPLRAGRGVWVQVTNGELSVNGQPVRAGDGIAISATDQVGIEGRERSEALVFDMAL